MESIQGGKQIVKQQIIKRTFVYFRDNTNFKMLKIGSFLRNPKLLNTKISPIKTFTCTRNAHKISTSGNTLNYELIKTVPYPASTFYKTVTEVDAYSAFLPFCQKSTISKYKTHRSGQKRTAMGTLHIGYGQLVDKYTSRVTVFDEKMEVRAENRDGMVFREMDSVWQFREVEREDGKCGGSCEYQFKITYTMGNPLYATVAKSVFPTISKLMSDSFEKEVAKQCLDAT